MSLKFYSKMEPEVTEALDELIAECKRKDGDIPKMYWTVLAQTRDYPAIICKYEDNKLVGFLCYFFFSLKEVELTVLIHPEHRRKGIFTEMFQYVKDKVEPYGIRNFLFSFPNGNKDSAAFVKKLGAEFHHKEFVMTRKIKKPEKIPGNAKTALIKASLDDIPTLATIDNAAFNTDYLHIVQRFMEVLPEPNRQAWFIMVGESPVGKIHVRFDEGKVYIHDIGVVPEYQRKGYGTQAVRQMVNHLLTEGHQHLYLDVEAVNDKAIKVYKRCRFVLTRSDEFWQLTTKKPQSLFS